MYNGLRNGKKEDWLRFGVVYNNRTCLANHKITQISTRKYEDVRYKI